MLGLISLLGLFVDLVVLGCWFVDVCVCLCFCLDLVLFVYIG